MDHRLRFAPEVLARLGEELTPHPDVGIMELVRNAYDADADFCRIELTNASNAAGSLVIDDNGDGMTVDELARGFLLIGRSSKTRSPFTRKNRRKVGEKGLGRLAALRLGTKVEVCTRPKDEPGREYVLSIDWDEIDNSEAVEEVPLPITERRTELHKGTTVTISNLRRKLTKSDASRLSRALLLLCGPFNDQTAFTVSCDAPEFQSLRGKLTSEYLRWRTHRLIAELDDDGQITATLYNWREEVVASAGHEVVAQSRTGGQKDVPSRIFAPPAVFEMFMFNLNPSARRTEVRLAEQPTNAVKDWLKSIGGVHLYHRNLRVQPYGDNGDDWLGINLRRVVTPELRPSTNNSVGRIMVEDPDNLLRPKTDRSGFAETTEFLELQNFAKRALDWAASERLQQREQAKAAAKEDTQEESKSAEEEYTEFKDALKVHDPDALPLGDTGGQHYIQQVISRADTALDAKTKEIQVLRDELMLYRTLATVGTSTAVFAHEALRPAARIMNEVKTVKRRLLKRLESAEYQSDFEASVDSSLSSAETLQTFAKLPLRLLERDKRDLSDVPIDTVCESVVSLFRRYLDDRSIAVKLALTADNATVRTTVADVESILSNLLANAAHAFIRTQSPSSKRVIQISTTYFEIDDERGEVAIAVADTGPGIEMPLKEIWLPGYTTRENGTGLGLTIVRDVVADLKGRQEARANGELGGACVTVWLPARSVV